MSKTSEKPSSRLTYDLWPEVGQMLGLTRNATYAAANRGEIPTMRFGKLMKVPKAAIHKKLEAAGCALPDSTRAEDSPSAPAAQSAAEG